MNNDRLPKSVQSILNNPRLSGIHNTIGNIINVKDEHMLALDVALSSSLNFIVVDNESSAKEAINYLKDNKLGRATFLPLNIIKSRYIDNNTKERLEQVNGYIGVFSDLVEYSSSYKNIIENQLGNVILARDIDSMNLIAKILEYKYRVVSLDGELIYVGGSISGGTSYKSNIINLKSELDNNNLKLEDINNKIIKFKK